MKNFAASAALLLAGYTASFIPNPWEDASRWEIQKGVSVHTITVPDANVQAHFACQRLVPKQEN